MSNTQINPYRLAPASPGFNDLVLAKSPIAWWRMDDTGMGLALDQVGGSDGVYSNTAGVTLSDTIMRAGGIAAARFNNSNGWMSVDPATSNDLLLREEEKFCIEVFASPASHAATQMLFGNICNYVLGHFNALMALDASGHAYAGFTGNDGFAYTLASSTVVVDNDKYHWVFNYDGTLTNPTLQLIENGTAVAAYTMPAGSVAPKTTVIESVVGGVSNGATQASYSFHGAIGDVILYRRNLTVAEALAHYEAGAIP